MVTKSEVQKMTEQLEYHIERSPGEGFIARCVMNKNISVFSKQNDEKLKKGIHSAAYLYAKLHPTDANKSIIDGNFEMKCVE